LSRRLEKGLAARATESGQKAKKQSPEMQAWQAAGLHCSANERRADEASRDVEAWLKCKYMHGHLGEEFGGLVSSVTSFGLFITLDAMYVEGLVHITELGGEYYRFDEVRQELRGERSGMRYAIGTRVKIQVSRVDLDGRRIDFRLIQDDEGLVSRAMKDKGATTERQAVDGPGADRSGATPPKRASRKIAEPFDRSPLSPIQSAKAVARSASAKSQDKGKKPRRRT
jgi:ribonuclease R